MSRIYEALQRAEAERKGAPPEATATAPAAATRPSVAQAIASATATLDPTTLSPTAPEPSYAAATYAAPSATAVVEIPESATAPEPTYAPPLRTAVFSAEPPAATPNVPALDINGIVRRPWHLAMDVFPSLHRRGPSVEQFRSLRARLQEQRGTAPLKSLMISSGLPQEGKTYVTVNLAVSLALHRNSKVLLIDGDMRRSTLHHYFGTTGTPGLADFLASRATLTEVMQQPDTTSTPAEPASRIMHNLTLISAGDAGDKASDLAGNRRFDELIAAASPHFDWIIVDSSPVIPVSDGVALARSCDAVLLVARSGLTTFPVAQRAQEELKAARLLGFVLNAVKKPPVLGNYYGYDGSGE